MVAIMAIFMLTKKKKEEIVHDLAEKFTRQKIGIFSDFHGISVEKIQNLRKSLKKENAEYRVAKKTLFDRALKNADIAYAIKELKGEIGIAFGYENETSTAKILLKFARENESFKIMAGILNDRILTPSEVVRIAKLPPREILIGQLMSTLQFPARGLVTVLQGTIRNLVVVLHKIKK